jgi:pyrophosphate--fructose-6-phosphate 1-phosphotransferase
VIAGLHDALLEIDPASRLYGFLGGPSGLIDGAYRELKREEVDRVRNQGGFDLIGSGRTKIETSEQFSQALKHVVSLELDALVIIGGDDSNTNAAFLAEFFLAEQNRCCVIGVPKTIDGDLRTADIEISFGFDSAAKTYAEAIGNIGKDALSAKKYYHFIKLMGRSASNIALECALLTQPNSALIGEEKLPLSQIVGQLAQLVLARRSAGKSYGVILLPEGLVEFIPEVKGLIQELNERLARGDKEPLSHLSDPSRAFFHTLPEKLQRQLLLERDPHGNVQVSQIETEALLIDLVSKEVARQGGKMSAVPHFLGYEGRSCLPTNFDASYCQGLGRLAALAIRDRLTGVMMAMSRLGRPVDEWECRAVPIVQLLHPEVRKGEKRAVIRKALVDLQGPCYRRLEASRTQWALEDEYLSPGPIQFFGPPSLTDAPPQIVSVLR